MDSFQSDTLLEAIYHGHKVTTTPSQLKTRTLLLCPPGGGNQAQPHQNR